MGHRSTSLAQQFIFEPARVVGKREGVLLRFKSRALALATLVLAGGALDACGTAIWARFVEF